MSKRLTDFYGDMDGLKTTDDRAEDEARRAAQHFTRRAPSLREHLGADPSGAGFEHWAATTIATQRGDLPTSEARFVRLMNTFMVACVEQMNREAALDPSPEGIADALAMWARAAGYTTVMAIASVSEEAAPLRKLARELAEDFKIGGKLAADDFNRPAHGDANGGARP